MAKQLAGVALRLWTTQGTAVRFIRQVAPAVEDLTARRGDFGPQAGDYPTGAWGAQESRDYHVCVEITPAPAGREKMAARVQLIAGPAADPELLGEGVVVAKFTTDHAESAKIDRHVAAYTDQAELAGVIEEGLAARDAGDDDTATDRFGRAVALASRAGNAGTARLLAKVVDVVDAEKGTVQLRKDISKADQMALDTRRFTTVRTKK